jgi:hypothetical protein
MLVEGALKQVELVQEVVDDVPVLGALCFVEADLPLIGGAFTTRGVHVLRASARLGSLREEDCNAGTGCGGRSPPLSMPSASPAGQMSRSVTFLRWRAD